MSQIEIIKALVAPADAGRHYGLQISRMRYTHHRGLARVTDWVTLKFACMNLKKLATWSWNSSDFFCFFARFFNSRVNYAVPA